MPVLDRDPFEEKTGGRERIVDAIPNFSWTGGVRILLLETGPGRTAPWRVGRFELVDAHPQDHMDEGFTLSDTAAQHLLDGLWRLGLRPSDYRDERAEAAAVRERAGDLRHICDRLLDLMRKAP